MTMHNPFLDADQMSLAELRVRIEADHAVDLHPDLTRVGA